MGPDGSPGARPEGVAPNDQVDPELLSLPAPPRAKRLATLTLMALVAAVSLGVLGSLEGDLRYFCSSPTALDLGEAVKIDPAALVANRYVRVRGMPMAADAVRYSHSFSGDEYAVFPLAGQRHVLVSVELGDPASMRTSARRDFTGRLVTLGELGTPFAAVRDYLARDMGVSVSSETFVVLADRPPSSYVWSVLLALMCIAFIVTDIWLMVRWFRPIKARP